MYSPTTRLLTILELLQSHQQMSGAEMAHRLEVDVRSVRRYIVMLQDMGIPVEAERGPGGAYRLRRGYKLPPLMFTDAEAIALTLGLLAIREFHFPIEVATVEGALAKTERVMPEKLFNQARALQEAVTFNVVLPPVQLHNDFISPLSLAAVQCRRVHLHYQAYGSGATERDFDPYGVVFQEGYWYTAGYCHLRRDLRTFRLDRILSLEPLEAYFNRPDNFDVLGQVLDSLATMPGVHQVEVLLKTSLERARQAFPPGMGTLEQAEEGVIFRRAAYQLEWIAHSLLGVDFPIKVIGPPALRDLLRQIVERALESLA
jgi:predicted DNA-binding transcriptional regulator YafY